MTHLLDDGSCEVQKLAYQLLHKAAKKHTEHLVIEAGVDSDGVLKAELPGELLDILGIEVSAPDRDGHSAVSHGALRPCLRAQSAAARLHALTGMDGCVRPFCGRREYKLRLSSSHRME